MDPALATALSAVAVAVVSGVAAVATAILTNRGEKEDAADVAIRETLEQRILLRDEQIAALEHKVAGRDGLIAELRAALGIAEKTIETLREELRKMRRSRRQEPKP